MVIFKSKWKKLEGDLKIKLCSKRLYLTKNSKYLVVKIDTNLSWQCHVSLKILRSIYFAIFDSYLSYCCLVWVQNCSTIQWNIILQKKAIGIISFQPRNFHTSPLFKQNSILKFQDKICLENILFISKTLNNLSPSVFNTWFSFSSDQHNYEISSSAKGNIIKPMYKTNRYRKYSITLSAIESWNKIQKQLKDTLLKGPIKLTIVSNFYLISY